MFTPTAAQSQAQPHLLLVLGLSGVTAVRHAAAMPSLRQRNSRLQDSYRLVPGVCMLVAGAGEPRARCSRLCSKTAAVMGWCFLFRWLHGLGNPLFGRVGEKGGLVALRHWTVYMCCAVCFCASERHGVGRIQLQPAGSQQVCKMFCFDLLH